MIHSLKTLAVHLGTIIVVILSLSSQYAYSQDAFKIGESILVNNKYGELLSKVKTEGEIRVLVELMLDKPFKPEGELPQDAVKAQREAIKKGQDALLNKPVLKKAKSIKKFNYTPGLAMVVDLPGLEDLIADKNVMSVQEDIILKPSLSQSIPIIQANNAWEVGYSGAGQAIAIIDTGVDKNHPFLKDKVVSEACYSTENFSSIGFSTLSLCPNGSDIEIGSGAGEDCGWIGCEHGTHVAGIAAGNGGAAGIGFSGVAKEANIIAIQVFSLNVSTFPSNIQAQMSDIIRALERVFDLRFTYNIAAVNMSLGGGKYDSVFQCDAANSLAKMAIDNLNVWGIATVVASGNESYSDGLATPACISSAVSVGSTTSWDTVADYSNSASWLSLLAPGDYIYSSIPGGGYAFESGTSMAAPHAAGTWAIMKQRMPSASVDEILWYLQATGVSITDERNDQTTSRINVNSALSAIGGPDLTLKDISAISTKVIAGQSFNIANTVQNKSTSYGSSGFKVRFYLSTDTTITDNDVLIGERYVPGLAAGASDMATTLVTVPETLEPTFSRIAFLPNTVYYIGAIADALRVVPETHELNNFLVGATIRVEPNVDFVLTKLNTAATIHPQDAPLTINRTVMNQGVSTSLGDGLEYGSGPSVSFYLSTDNAITTNDIFIGTGKAPKLVAGQSSSSLSFGISPRIPADLVPGMYYIGAIVDAANQFAETNESNNGIVGNMIQVIPSDIDLIPVALSTTSASVFQGYSFDIAGTIKNQGSTWAYDTFYYELRLSSDPVITASDLYLEQGRYSGLIYGGSVSFTKRVPLPLNTAPGTYYIGIVVDGSDGTSNKIRETNENNNTLTGQVIQVKATEVDLVITAISTTLTTLRTSTKLPVTFTVKNQGTMSTAGSICIGFRLSTDTDINFSRLSVWRYADEYVKVAYSDYTCGQYVAALSPGASATYTWNLVVSAINPGQYYLGIGVDSESMIPETNEGNNIRAGSLITIIP